MFPFESTMHVIVTKFVGKHCAIILIAKTNDLAQLNHLHNELLDDQVARCMTLSIVSSSSGDLATRTISSAKIKCDMRSPSVSINLSSQLILLTIASCRHAVKSFGEMSSPYLTPLCRLFLSLSMWSFRVDVAPL